MITVLSRLLPGQSGTVLHIGGSGALKARLRDFGMVNGTNVVCRYCSPDRTVVALGLRGTVLALRRADIAEILVDMNG